MTKKLLTIFLAVIVLGISTVTYAQSTTDLIILLDSSQSMIPYYNDVAEFICKSILPSYLRYGDRFHVLTFSDTVQNPISKEVLTNADINAIVAGVLLLYPLGTSTDLITALESTWKWTLDLPSDSNKVIVMITDGMHAPLTSSPYYPLTNEAVKTEITRIADKIKSQNWTFKLITVPFTSETTAGTENSTAPGAGIYTETIANSTGTTAVEYQKGSEQEVIGKALSLIQISCPANLGKRNYTFRIPVTFTNTSDTEAAIEVVKVIVNGKTNVLNGKASAVIPAQSSKTISVPVAFPRDWQAGEQTITFEPVFYDNLRVIPPVLQTSVNLKYSFIASIVSNVTHLILSILIIAAIIALVIIILLYIRSIHKQAEQPVVDAVYDSMQVQQIAGQSLHREQRAAQVLASTTVKKSATTLEPTSSSHTAEVLTHVPAVTTETPEFKTKTLETYLNSQKKQTQNVLETIDTHSHKNIETITTPKRGPDKLSVLTSVSSMQKARQEQLFSKLQKKEPAQIVVRHKAPIEYNPSIVKPGTIKVEFIVENQNRCIGNRNIKVLHAGGKKTIGGKLSDFYIFLYPFPNRIADVYYDGESLIVVPRKFEYFPDYDAPITVNLDEHVRILTKKGKEVFFKFTAYIPPYEKINKILHCVKLPGRDIAEKQSE